MKLTASKRLGEDQERGVASGLITLVNETDYMLLVDGSSNLVSISQNTPYLLKTRKTDTRLLSQPNYKIGDAIIVNRAFILLVDDESYLLQTDGTSKINVHDTVKPFLLKTRS